MLKFEKSTNVLPKIVRQHTIQKTNGFMSFFPNQVRSSEKNKKKQFSKNCIMILTLFIYKILQQNIRLLILNSTSKTWKN